MKKVNYTNNQKYAIISILILIMEADGIIDPNEVEFLNKILKDFSITEEEIELIGQYDLFNSSHIIKSMSSIEKEKTIELFLGMAKCDGYVDSRELMIIENLAKD